MSITMSRTAHKYFMSLLGNIKEKTISKMTKLHDNPVSCEVMVNRVIPSVPGSGRPTSFTVTLLEDAELPYYFKATTSKSKSKNLVTEAVAGAKSIKMKAGQKSFYVSMFKAPPHIEKGGFYRIDDFWYEMYRMNPGDPLSISFSCSRLTPIPTPNFEQVMRAIPFEDRSFNVQRDIPGEDRMEYLADKKTDEFRWTWIKVGAEEFGTPDTIFGMFTLPENMNDLVTSYVPYSETEVLAPKLALTGGRKMVGPNETVVDNQFMLQQNEKDKDPILIMCLTKPTEEDGLKRLQMDWKTFAPVIAPYLVGDAFGILDRERTKDAEIEEEASEFAGVIKGYTSFYPDLGKMMKKAGFKMSWKSCVALDARLATPSHVTADTEPLSPMWIDALNILQYTGDVSLLEEAEKQGWVEFYALTNRVLAPKKRLNFQATAEEQVLKELLDEAEYPGKRYTVIMAVVTATSPCPVKDFVTVIGKAAAASLFETNKRVKAEEEEEEK